MWVELLLELVLILLLLVELLLEKKMLLRIRTQAIKQKSKYWGIIFSIRNEKYKKLSVAYVRFRTLNLNNFLL